MSKGNPRIVIRMPPEEIEALKVAAARVGVPMAEHARSKLRENMTLAPTNGDGPLNIVPGSLHRAPLIDTTPPAVRSLGRLPTSTVRKVGYEPG